MSGGEIIVRGNVGDDAGARMRRGLLVVTGDGGRGMGIGMIAGTVVVFGKAGPGAGRFLKRGSIVALASIERPATFRYACTYRPPHVGLLLRYLRDRAGVPVADRYVAGKYERYSGDLAELGKGEILQWAGEWALREGGWDSAQEGGRSRMTWSRKKERSEATKTA